MDSESELIRDSAIGLLRSSTTLLSIVLAFGCASNGPSLSSGDSIEVLSAYSTSELTGFDVKVQGDSQSFPEDTFEHVLSVTPSGNAKSIKCTVHNEQLVNQITNAKAEPVGAIMKALYRDISDAKAEGREPKPVLIYIHGGLNSFEGSIRRARDLLSQQSGLTKNYFPILVHWRSDLVSSYFQNLGPIWQGEDFAWGTWRPLKILTYLATDVAQTIVGAPKSWLVQGYHSWQSVSLDALHESPNSNDYHRAHVTTVPANFDYKCGSDKEHPWARKGAGLILTPLKALSTPIVVEAGRASWNMMLRNTRTLFWNTSALDAGQDGKAKPRPPIEGCEGCGGLNSLLVGLWNLQQSHGIHITLVGHSMGAIVANQVVAEVPELQFDNIVHMASADSIENTFALTLDYMRTENGQHTQFYSLMLQGDNENREVSGKGLMPSGSLLAWIDNMFSDPPTSLSKRAGRWSNMQRFESLVPEEVGDRVHFTVFEKGVDGHPQEHSDFDECEFWTTAYWDGTDPIPPK